MSPSSPIPEHQLIPTVDAHTHTHTNTQLPLPRLRPIPYPYPYDQISTPNHLLTHLTSFSHQNSTSTRLPLHSHLPLLPTRDITPLTRHDLTRMNNIEQRRCNEHKQRVKTVLVDFVAGNSTVQTPCVLDETEDDTCLQTRKRGLLSTLNVSNLAG